MKQYFILNHEEISLVELKIKNEDIYIDEIKIIN